MGPAAAPAPRIRRDLDAAWRLFFKALPRPTAAERVAMVGYASLARPYLSALAVMA
jgi:hypothetical protein